eukprot:2275046-Pleurochrysis_carterae.AAC.4
MPADTSMRAIAAAFLLTTLAGQTEAFHFQTTARPQLMLSKSAPSALRTVSTSSSLPPGQLSLLRCPRHAQLALLEGAQASQPLEKAGIWAAWFAYLALVLFSEGSIAPGASALHTEPETISEAISLSLNFWFVLPTIAPQAANLLFPVAFVLTLPACIAESFQVAPVLSPSLEAVFNVIVSWSALFFGALPFIPAEDLSQVPSDTQVFGQSDGTGVPSICKRIAMVCILPRGDCCSSCTRSGSVG